MENVNKIQFLINFLEKVEQVRDGCVVVVLVTAPADVTTARTDAHNFLFFSQPQHVQNEANVPISGFYGSSRENFR